jgi:hypothetical protein
VTAADAYTAGRESGRAIGYLGCLALCIVVIPDALVWLVAGVFLHTPLIGLLGLFLATPIVVYQLWQTYLRWVWKRADLKATRRATDAPADDDEPPVAF